MKHTFLTRAIITSALLLSLIATPAQAQSNASDASAISALSGVLVVSGTVFMAGKASEAIVTGVVKVGESVVVTLRAAGAGASEASTASVQFSGRAASQLGLAAGQSVRVMAESTGWALYASAALVAFIPNEIGKSLIHQTRAQ